MPTFLELQNNHAQASFKKAVLSHIIEYIDYNFRPSAGADPKSFLKTDDGRAVPQEAFESVITEILLVAMTEQDRIVNELLQSNLQPVQPEAVTTEEQSNVSGTTFDGQPTGFSEPQYVGEFPATVPVPIPEGPATSDPIGRRPSRRAAS